MSNASTLLVSILAFAMSAVTTFLTYFDTRYQVTAAVVDVAGGRQSGGSSSDGEISTFVRYYATPTFLLSNRGARPMVFTDVELVKSTSLETCEASDVASRPFGDGLERTIIERGELRTFDVEFALGVDEHDGAAAVAARPDREELWCLRLTLFDQRGERREPMFPAVRASMAFSPPTADDRYGDVALGLDFPPAPVRIIPER